MKRLNHKDKLWYAKEEVKDLDRLLREAQERLNKEYVNIGGRTWFQWTLYIIGWSFD